MGTRQTRWAAVGVLVLSSSLNYLDRTLLSALMPTLRAEFRLTGEDLGNLVAVFSLVYGLSSPLVGLLIDRLGLTWGAALVVAMWSLAGMATGLAGTFTALLVCRGALGFAEAGGIPATGKGYASYLAPEDRALGAAAGQAGITLGIMAAPLLAEWMLPVYGWRSAFVVAGALGFVWVPLWLWTARRVPPVSAGSASAPLPLRAVLSDSRYLALVAANSLAMTVYSLWTTWSTQFLVSTFGLTQAQANLRYVWIPPIFATAGAVAGGWLALQAMRGGADAIPARLRIAGWSSLFCLATAAAPLLPGPGWSTAAVSLSLFAMTALSVNYYALPLDLFGAPRAALAVSFLTGVFGLMQAFLAPQIGRWSDETGWTPVCLAVALLPAASVVLLRVAFRDELT